MGAQKTWATIIGIILLLVGILGFFMTTPLLGLFQVNVSHNIVHLVTGAIFLWAGLSKSDAAKPTNQWLGVIYIVVAILGFLGLLTFLAVGSGNDMDNWLHLIIGIVSAAIGWFVK
ncbi:MAG: DUF4383 domain-containing protein [Nanoarchaeota archaeon]|nr:DUF4383 domain-containing protein [Nanoarchaeota archaeon]